ncbi:MAG: membrane dipeptidase [Firmicutes bacterium]|nr:membrane dipeptidase [Bacillota bacterium]
MEIFDAHIDTLSKIHLRQTGEVNFESLDFCHVDLKRMRQGGITAQVFAIFIHPRFKNIALEQALSMVELLWQLIDTHQDAIGLVKTAADFDKLKKENKISAILSLEGGEALQGNIGLLRIFYELGVRALSLTWNHRNELADGVGEKEPGGLSDRGKEVISEMDRLGMVIDVSHLGEKGFWDIISLSKNPIIASHSNAKALCNHRRNLTDEQIKAIADSGGVIGVNFLPEFLVDQRKNATIETVLDHITYLINIGGIDVVGLGSDFDGIDSTPQGLEDCAKVPAIIHGLEQRGFSGNVIEKIMAGNMLRVFKSVLK